MFIVFHFLITLSSSFPGNYILIHFSGRFPRLSETECRLGLCDAINFAIILFCFYPEYKVSLAEICPSLHRKYEKICCLKQRVKDMYSRNKNGKSCVIKV